MSVCMSEVYAMYEDGEQFVEEIRQCLRVFNEQTPDNMAALLKMASVSGYDPEEADFIPYEGNTREYHLLGIAAS